MSGFLLDTHVWLWYLAGSERLPRGLRAIVDSAPEPCWLSPVSIWEAGMLAAAGRLESRRPFRQWVDEALAALPLQEASMTREVALASREVRLPHRDPADHFLAATALSYGLTLLTVDRRLTRARGVPTRSG